MGFLRPGEASERSILIEDALKGTTIGKNFPIRSIEFVKGADSSLFEIQTSVNGPVGEITVRFPGTEARGPFAEEIKVAITTDLGRDILQVRLAGHVVGE